MKTDTKDEDWARLHEVKRKAEASVRETGDNDGLAPLRNPPGEPEKDCECNRPMGSLGTCKGLM